MFLSNLTLGFELAVVAHDVVDPLWTEPLSPVGWQDSEAGQLSAHFICSLLLRAQSFA